MVGHLFRVQAIGSSILPTPTHAGVTQLAEVLRSDRRSEGSTPSVGTNLATQSQRVIVVEWQTRQLEVLVP